MTDEEFRGLQERAALIKDMAEHPGWSVAYERGYNQLHKRQQEIIQGRCKTYNEYMAAVGWCQGMGAFMETPEKIQEELEVELRNREEE